MKTIKDLTEMLTALKSGQAARVAYNDFDRLFPPGIEHEASLEAARSIASALGLRMDNPAGGTAVYFYRSDERSEPRMGQAAPPVETDVSKVLRLIYASENGDQWFLVTDANSVLHVRHVPNESSGGQPSESTIERFMSRERHSPQHRALQHILGEGPLANN